ncbi:(R)-limonene synthase 1, chloroplastic-like [Pistacia vera]|uniref:(R)-limonene synthase 1, chloroplastic-like n=1 Tax=Pistacia vera TaxID=55513 RepID=UPI0012630B79|nr:(R)-limonene synthase 1, chloroplastic-like [Pistacia vera]
MAFCIASTCNIPSGAIFQHRQRLVSKTPTSKISVKKQLQCIANPELSTSTVVRRSGNYKPCIFNEDYLPKLTNEYTGEAYRKKAEKLTEEVRMIINSMDNPLDQLELIDNLQRLGVANHFEREIKNILDRVHNISDHKWKKGNLYATSLEFRLLRKHGYYITEEVFESFKDKTGSFSACVSDDVKAILSFYEASFYGLEGESMMQEAWEFSSKHLKDLDEKDVDQNLVPLVEHALELPLHWWAPRFETKWFIDSYERREDKNHLLLELAKVDFNILQGIHQEELKDTLRWWENTGLRELTFARINFIPAYLWGLGVAFQPQYSYCRKFVAKAVALITLIDDIYDVYGTLPELELLTDAITRWDIKAMKQLPSYMKTSFLSLFNFVNEVAHHVLKEKNSDVSMTLIKMWKDMAQAQITEARWYHDQYKPTLDEYLNNAYISVTGPIMATLSYISSANPILEKDLEFLESNPDIIKWSSTAFRLQDDLGTSPDEMKRGDVPKAIQCYMNDTGCSEEVAREYIKDLTRKIWKKINVYRAATNCPLPQPIVEMIINLLRTSHYFYRHGDGHGGGGQEIKDVMLSSLFQPIPLSEIK